MSPRTLLLSRLHPSPPPLSHSTVIYQCILLFWLLQDGSNPIPPLTSSGVVGGMITGGISKGDTRGCGSSDEADTDSNLASQNLGFLEDFAFRLHRFLTDISWLSGHLHSFLKILAPPHRPYLYPCGCPAGMLNLPVMTHPSSYLAAWSLPTSPLLTFIPLQPFTPVTTPWA